MTKQEVLNDIDKLCDQIHKWRMLEVKNLSDLVDNINEEDKLVTCAHSELRILRDYIEENVKEAPITWKRVKDGSYYEQVCIDEYDNGRMVLCNGDYEMDIEALLKLPREE